MKNMKVRTKLLTGFFIIAALTLVVGIVGIVSLFIVDRDYTEAIELHGKPLAHAGHALASVEAVRAELRAAMLFTGNRERVQAQAALVQGYLDEFESRAALYDPSVKSADSRALFDEAMNTYRNAFLPAVDKVLADAENGVAQTELTAFMVSTIKPAVDLVINNFSQCMINKENNLDTTSTDSSELTMNVFFLLVGLLVVTTVISVVLGLYLSGLISRPLMPLTGFMQQAGTTGDLHLQAEAGEALGKYAQRRDELGQLIVAARSFADRVAATGQTLEKVADGDLTAELPLLSPQDTIGLALKKMLDNLNGMFSDINMSASQVSIGSTQVADGAQALASGSTEQAASIEELSGSMAEVADKTKTNSALAEQAAELAGTIKGNAEKGSRQMDAMISAVKEINEASNSISKVIKTIDDIAFQTNILALNAAVEAARAGQHGKGFAVVAEEVRNLAAKSAEAAKDTESLIANSMQKAELGVSIAGETAISLSEIVAGINESSTLITEIAKSSEGQSMSMIQINAGIDQVAQVVQQNSATAEESAAASEEMSGQATMLQQLIAQFRLKDSGSSAHAGY